METGESSTHLYVSRTSTVDSTTSTNTNSSFDDGQQENDHEVKGERSLPQQRTEHFEGSNGPGEARRPSIGLRETRIIISQDDGVTIDNGGEEEEEEDEDEEARKRAESLHKLHQQHALDSWDQEGDSASSSSRSSSNTRISPRLSPSPSHRAHRQVRHTCSNASSSVPPNINSSISLMCLGSSVMKVKRQGRTSSKMLYLDSTRSYIRWKPSKKGHKAIVNIKNVREIREGACTDTFKKHLASTAGHKPSHCFSIIHGTSWESLDIVAGSLDEAQAWIRGLRHLMEQAQEETAQSDQLRDSWLKSVFESADKSGDGLLSMDEVLKLLHKLNVNLSKRKVKQLFREADTNIDEHLGKLDFDEFVHFYKTLSMRPELYALLREYSCGKEHMTLEDLDVFLRNEQDINKQDERACRGLIEKYEPVPENVCNGRLGIDGLMRYLLSEEGDLFNSGHRGVNQDMTQPLSHYYIASSHNTYLLGDQLMSQSSVDVYGLVLQAGCRCVELDTWDGKEGEPVIYHGYTLTSKIKFRDVITVVNKYAFVSSPYPVILSIENHCTLEQQKKMARYLLEILGDQLIISSPTDGGPGGLPSPDSLKYKILIKAKKLPLDHDADLEAGEVSEEDSADELDDDFKLEKTETRSKFESIAMAQLALMRKKPISPSQQAWQRIAHKRLERLRALLEATELKEKNTENKASKNGRTGLTGTFRKLKATRRRAKLQHSSESDNNSSMEFDRSSSRDDDLEGGTNENQQVEQRKQRLSSTNRKRAFVLSRQLSDLVKYTRSVAFKGFPENMPCWELPSLGEMRANNLAATRAADFANFTTHNLCRVYPSAYRIDSSNFNPQTLWNCGCQLVALNYQTEGRAMQLLRAKFRANGNCGYLLKPSILRQDKVHFDPTSNNPIPGVQKKQLTIHIISGQQLPKPPQSLLGERGEIIDPYVEVEVIGLNGDCTKAQTKTVQDNGFNPVWDYVVTFPITLPELTLIRFVVWDEDPIGRDFIGQATFPFISLCQGYRHIHLEGLDHATIFVHVTIEDFTDKKYIKNSKGLRSTSITRTTSSPSRNRTKSIDAEVNLLTGGSPAHQASPKRRTSLAERLGIRRRHSTTALLVEGIMTGSGGSGGIKSPTSPTSTPTFGLLRQKRRSYEGEMRKGRSQGDEEGCDDVFGDDDCDLIPVDCDAILDRIMASEVAVELEADGSVSVPLNEIVHILRLGISPSQIIQVIQDCRLSLRPALHDVPPISAPGNSWDVAAGEDVDSGPMDTREGLGSGVLSQFKHYDPEPAPTLSRVLDDDDLVFPTNNNDISTEMEALLSARFTKERLAFGMVSYDEFSSTEDCSSLGSAEDFMTDNLATDHVINNSSGDLVPGENGLISKEGHVKVEQETERQQTVAGLPEVANSSEGKVQGRSINEPEGVLDNSCKNENQGSDYDNQGDSLCDVVIQDENVVHVCRSVVVASEPDESLQKSNLDDQPSRDNEATSDIGSPGKFSSCIRNSHTYSDISHSTTEDVHNVNSIDQSQGQMQYSDPEEREGYDQGQVYMQHLSESDAERHPQVQSKYSVEGHMQGQAEEELGLLSQCHTQNSEQSGSGEQLGSLSNVVDSMFDLVASLAEEERELQTLEERNLVREGWNANVSPTNKEGNLDSDSTEDLPPTDCTLVSSDCSEDSTMQAQRPSSPQYTGNRQFHVYSSQQSRYFEDPLNDTDFIDASCNLPESSDSLDAHGQSRPLAPTGLSPDTPPLKNVNLTSQKNGDLADDNVRTAPEKVTPNSSASCRGPRKKSLVKVLSGLLQKYELFDAKQSESFSKGIRSSLRKRFMTRSVPDISKMIFKEEGENVVKESNGYLRSVAKKVWSSSNQDIRTTGPVSKSFENLCDIVEESQTSKMALRFSSSYTDIATTKNGSFPYRPDLSDDSAHMFNPDKELDTDDCIHATQEDVDGSDISKVVVITEDKAISPQYTGNRQFHVYSSQQSRYFEDPLNDTDFIDASCNLPESSDSLDAHGQSRPLAPTGLSPDTPPLKNVNLTSQKNGDLADDNVRTAPEKVTPNSSASCRGPRKKSLVKVLSGLLQKYELFDAKQSESFSKGIRSSLRKRFMTRSVPDISKMIFKEEGENVVKESNGYLRSVAKKVWSSSNQDIRTTGPVSKSFENLCDIVEESQTSKMALRFSSSYTDIATTKNGSFPYRPDLSDDSAHMFNPDKELDTDDCIHATQEDVDGSDISKVVVITEDKAVQTDSVPPKYLPKASQVNRLIPGSWNRDGQPTRPLSCPVLPQETGNESNKHRIVYFHEQPLKKLQNSSSGKQKKFTKEEGPKEDVQQCSENEQLDLEDIRVTLADVSSEDPDSADDEGELSSHICIVQGCNCGNSNLSNLLDSSLLVETCFTGDDDERAKKVEQQAGVNFEKGSDDYVRKYKEDRDATESNAADDIPTLDCLTSGIDKPVAALKSIHDDNDKESRISIGMGHSISSIHTHLGGLRRSIGTFRSEYNRSFDDGDNTDEEENTLTCSPQKTVLPETCTNEQTSSDLKQESILCAPDLKPIHEIEILDDSFSSESIPSTNSNDGTSASENIDTDPELLENPVSDRDADTSTEEEGLDAQERNVTPTNDVHDQFSLLKDTNEESKTGQENNAQVNIQEARPKSVSSESSYDMFKSLEELSTVLDDELLHGRKHGRSSSSVSCAFHSIQPVKALEPIRDDVRSATLTSSEVGNGESTCTRTGQSELDCPSAICNSKVLAKPDKLPAGSSATSEEGLSTSKETAHERPLLPARPVIGSAISVRFLGQIPRQMSAYSYSDSDSDYDSTTSGSSQETIVEVIPTHPKFARQMVKPPVPPKSPRLKAQLVKQGSKEKPPVPPKPQHIKALAAEKRAKALQKSISLATSPDITFPEIPPKTVVTEDSSGFKIKDRITGMESKTGALNRNGHNEMLSSGMLSPGLVHSLSSIPSNESITPRDPHHSPPNKHSPSLHEHLESMYNVTMRKKFRAKPPLEQRHSTGSLFSLTDLPSIRDKAGKFPSADQEAIPDKEFLDKLDQSVESWSLDRKRQSSQRVYFMLNV